MLKHQQSRRAFIKQSVVVASGTLLVPAFLKANPVTRGIGRALVVIQLSGGNDGLNTVIPYRNEILAQARPTLMKNAGEVLKLTDEVGFNTAMRGLARIYDQGDLAIINAVGYPNPNRSHFRSMDIWHSASDTHQYWDTGWLGRYLDHECSDEQPVTSIQLGDRLGLAMKGKEKKGIPLTNVDQYYQSSRLLTDSMAREEDNSLVSFLYKTQADVKSSAAYLYEKNKIYKSKRAYPRNKFGQQLREVAEMIISGVESPVYYLSLSGFDTHNAQKARQSRLLKTYSEGLKVFMDDLKANDRWNETLVMTFSEFGRRVKENASRGTDHGKANHVFIAGGQLNQPGLYNPLPDLTHLDSGDVPFQIDFRSVYATVLDRWLGTDADKVLGRTLSRLDFIV